MTLCLATQPSPSPRLSPPSQCGWLGHIKVRPAATMAAYVDHYWVTRWDRRDKVARVAAALLDPCVHLQVCNGRAEVVGIVRGTFSMTLDHFGCVVGVRFRPGGAYPFIGRPISRWTSRSVPAEEALGSDESPMQWVGPLWKEMITSHDTAEAYAGLAKAHLDAFLEPRLRARDPVAEEMAALVDLIATRPDIRRVSDLATASRRSQRTLHRLFLRYVGVSPAWVVRRYRLQAAAERLTRNPRTDIGRLAYELGYADQAHFIRDFRATIGLTPGAYVGR